MKFLITSIFMLVSVLGRSAVPTFNSFEPTQFDTNLLSIKYRSDWTNEVGVLHPATVNTEVTVTNFNLYETFVMPAKVQLLSLGTNELDVSTNSTWLLYSPTNDASQVILSLSAGKFQGQLLFITSQNSDGAFILPDLSEQYDTPGAYVDLQGDWIASTNRGLILQYSAPDWIEMDRSDPGNPNGPFPVGESIWTNIVGVIQPIDGQTTNTLQFMADPGFSGNIGILGVGGTNYFRFNNNGWLSIVPPGDTTSGRVFISTVPSPFDIDLQVTDTSATFKIEDSSLLTYFNPGVASGSATAYLFNTSQVLTNGDKLMSIGNAGVETLLVSPWGGIFSHRNTLTDYGNPAEGDFFVGGLDSSLGDIDTGRITISSSIDSNFTDFGTASLVVSTNTASMEIFSYTNNLNSGLAFNAFLQDPEFDLLVDGNFVTRLRPASAATTASYVFNTSLTHTIGNLFELANNGTNLYYFEAAPLSPRMHVDDKNGNSVQVGLGAGTGFISSGNGLNLIGASGVIGLSSFAFTPSPASTIDLAASSFPFKNLFMDGDITLNGTTNTVKIAHGAGSPEGVLALAPGSFYLDLTNGEAYIKVTGTGNTGWKLVTHAAIPFLVIIYARRKRKTPRRR